MRRRLLNLLTVLSLLLFVAVCVLWVRSYQRNEDFTHAATLQGVPPDGGYDRLVHVGWGKGTFIVHAQYSSLSYTGGPSNVPRGWSGPATSPPSNAALGREGRGWTPRRLFWAKLGFSFRWDDPLRPPYIPWCERMVVVPFWLVAMSSLLLPAASAWRYVRNRLRKRVGLCHICGYDLRATPGRCPECGTEPTAVPSR